MRWCAWISIVVFLLFSSGCSRKEPTKAQQPAEAGGQQAENQTQTETTETVGTQATVLTDLNYEQSNGDVLYHKYCSVCHGVSGKGDGFNAYNLQPASPRNFTDAEWMSNTSDEQLFEVITQGGGGTGRSILMPAWGKTLSTREVRYLISYLHSLAAPS